MIEFGVGEGSLGLGDGYVFVALDGEVGQDLEDGLEVQWLAVGELNVGYLGLRDGLQLLLVDRGAEVVGQYLFDDILANLLGEARADQRVGHFAGAEAGDARLLLIALGDFAELLGDFVRGNVDGDFAGAVGV